MAIWFSSRGDFETDVFFSFLLLLSLVRSPPCCLTYRYCNGLYRDLQNYDFVGNMGSDYARVLQTLTEKFDHAKDQKFPSAVQKVFRVKFSGTEDNTATRSLEKNKRNRQTASKLEKFYTPRTVRRVLEYLAIDYVKLNLRE